MRPLLTILFIAATSLAQSEGDHGWLKVLSSEEGVKVYVNGEFVGETPLILPLPAGEHEVRALNPHRSSWLERDWISQAEIVEGDTCELKVRFPTYYIINTQPFDASVIAQGVEVGRTPLILPSEKGRIILKKEGYKDRVVSLDGKGDRFFHISLEEDQKFQREKLHLLKETHWTEKRRKTLLCSTIALGLASGAAALYFKHRADRAYNEYLVAGDPEDMNRLFNDTKRYDTLWGISYGFFEVSFLLTFYLFLKGL